MIYSGETIGLYTTAPQNSETDAPANIAGLEYTFSAFGAQRPRRQYKFVIPFTLSDSISGFRFLISPPALILFTSVGYVADNAGAIITSFVQASPQEVLGVATPAGDYFLIMEGLIHANAAGVLGLGFAVETPSPGNPIVIFPGATLQLTGI